MDHLKRNKRKIAKQMRKRAWLRGQVMSTATVTMYGRNAMVESVGVVIHRRSEIITTRVFLSRDYASGEAMMRAALDFVVSQGGAKVYMVNELLPTVNDEGGHPFLNVADRLPEDVN